MTDARTAMSAAQVRGLRVLVCGGRDYRDTDHVHNTLCYLDAERGPITCIIHGAATGADHEGMTWAQMMAESGRKLTHAPFPPDWDNLDVPGAVIRYRRDGVPYNAAAGPIRNQRMLDQGKPDLVVAFPSKGPGTRDMMRRARAAGIEIIEIKARS